MARTVTVRCKSGRFVAFPHEDSGRMFECSAQVEATLDEGDRVVEIISVPEEDEA